MNLRTLKAKGQQPKELEVKLLLQQDLEFPMLKEPTNIENLILPQSIQKMWQKLGFHWFAYQEDNYYDNKHFSLIDRDIALRNRVVHEYEYDNQNRIWQARLDKEQSWMTYKGPRESGQFKLRTEIEQAMPEEIWTILRELDFFPTKKVYKARWMAYQSRADWPQPILFCLDAVKNLGLYLEIEIPISSSNSKNSKESNEEEQRGQTLISQIIKQWELDTFAIEEKSYVSLVRK